MLESLKNKKILVIVAHPDDELLGIGGTLNRLVLDYNSVVKVVILGEGLTSRVESRNVEIWEKELTCHKNNIETARKLIGYQELSVYDLPDNRFDTVPLLDIIKIIEKEKSAFEPDVVFTHHGGDVNIDHQRTCEAVITSCRPMESEHVQTILCFETPSGTEWRSAADPKHFIPNVFIALEARHLRAKISGMEAYTYEKRAYPHPRSPEALTILAQRWGIAVGKEYAEAFMLVRSVN